MSEVTPNAYAFSATHMDIIDVDLDTGTVHRSYNDHVICMDDELANVYGARLFAGKEPVQLTGGATCAGYFIRPNGDTVVIEGYITAPTETEPSSTCRVVLPQACYAYPGQFTLVIKVSSAMIGGGTSTVRIVDGTVVKTRTGAVIDPGIPIPNIDELLGIIAAAQGHTYDASNGVTLSGATFKLTTGVRKQLNAVRGINIDNASHEPDNELYIDAGSVSSGWIAVIWHCGTGECYGLKFAHIAPVSGTDDEYYADVVTLAESGTDCCAIEFDDDHDHGGADPCWHITNTHNDARLRGIVLMNNPGDTFV